MKNFYIDQFKKSLQKLFNAQKHANDEILTNNARYLPELAERYNLEEKEKQDAAFWTCQQEIFQTFDTVRSCCARANFLTPDLLTADRLFFTESGFTLTVPEVRAFVEKYQGNFTMQRLISDWINRQPQTLQLNTVAAEIVMPTDMLMVYKRFGDEALRIAAKIHVNHVIMQQPIELDLFADESYHERDFSIIGTGGILNDYAKKQVPDIVLHQYDEVILTNTALEAVMI